MAKLVVVSGEVEQREFPLGESALVGRGVDCDVMISRPQVSRRHARITRVGDAYYIEDLGGANGTILNGTRINKARLDDGDRITLGDCELTFLLGEEVSLPEGPPLEETIPTIIDAVDLDKAATAEREDDASSAATLRARLEVLKEVSEGSCGTLETRQLVELMLGQLLRIYGQADHAHAILTGFDEDQGDLSLSVARAGSDKAQVGMSRTLFEMVTSQRKVFLAADVGSHQKLGIAESIVAQDLHSMMCCPLVVGSRTLGAIQVDTTRRGIPFKLDDLELLATIAGQVAVAAENSRLHREVVAQQRLAAVGEAVSSIAHCIKNVLNGLQGGAYILDLGVQKQQAEKIAKGWQMVKRNTDFMSELVRDMLAYCRRSRLRREPTDIGELLDDTVQMVQESAAQKGIETSLVVEGEALIASVDRAGLKRVVLNLLTNAIEACPEGSHVKVKAGLNRSSKQLELTVEDDGPGIPAEAKARLFEAFFTTKGSRGTGLGLALVRKVVEEHHGRVEVKSEPGQGAAFRISIPAEWDEDQTAFT